MRARCECGNLVEKSHTRVDGEPVWRRECRTCRGRYRYGILKADRCEKCGFIPEVSAQLEIDHIDGDNKNNDKSNLMTLCCNCHALKSYQEKNIRFPAENNPFFGRKHTEETLAKIAKNSNKKVEL